MVSYCPYTITPWTQFPPETWCLSGLWYHLYLNILTAATFRWFLAIYCTSRVRGIQDPMQVRGVRSSGDFPLQKTGLGLPSMHCCISYISCPSTVIVRWLQQCYTTNKCRFCSRIKTPKPFTMYAFKEQSIFVKCLRSDLLFPYPTRNRLRYLLNYNSKYQSFGVVNISQSHPCPLSPNIFFLATYSAKIWKREQSAGSEMDSTYRSMPNNPIRDECYSFPIDALLFYRYVSFTCWDLTAVT